MVGTCISGADCVLTLLRSCVCKPGYEGDGRFCVEMDPCSGSTPGGCSRYVSVALIPRLPGTLGNPEGRPSKGSVE